MLSSLAVVPAFAQSAPPGGQQPGGAPSSSVVGGAQPAPGQEIVELRRRYSSTAAGATAGEFETTVFDAPVHFERDGSWERIDRRLTKQASGRFGNGGRNDFTLSVAPDNTDRQLVRMESGEGQAVGFGLEGARPGGASPDPRNAEQDIVYRSILPHVSLRLTSLPDGVKDVLELASAKAATRYVFPLTLEGLTAELDAAGAVLYRDGAGQVVFITPPPWMMDSSDGPEGTGASSSDTSFQLVRLGDGRQALELTVSQAWLTDPARVFPVQVDPTITTVPFFYGDTYYASSNTSFAYTSRAYLDTGRNASGGQFRAFVQMGAGPVVPADGWHNISSARVDLEQLAVSNCNQILYLKRVTQAWHGVENTLAGQFGPTYDSASGTQVSGAASCPSTGQFSMDATEIARQWEDTKRGAGAPNHGLALLGSLSFTDTYRRFSSKEAIGDSLPPRMVVAWSNNPPSVPSDTARLSPAPNAALAVAPTRLSAGYNEPEGDWGYNEYVLQRKTSTGSWASFASGRGALSEPCCSSPWTIPTTVTPGSYRWRVYSTDSYTPSGSAPSSTGFYFFTLDAPPQPPQVDSTSHPQGTWQTSTSATVTWTEPASEGGIAGYSWSHDTNSGTNPVQTVNTTSRTASKTVPEGVSYFHVRAKNNAGQWSNTAHYAVRVDTTQPAPPAVSSSTHPDQNRIYPAQDATVSWTAGDISGITGYSWTWDTLPGTTPDEQSEGTAASTSKRLDLGKDHYFHVRARNGSGLWGAPSHFKLRVHQLASPSPVAPANGVTLNTTTPTLEVGPVTDADGQAASYRFQVSTSDSFAAPVADSQWQTQTSWPVPQGALSEGSTYTWRAWARDRFGNQSLLTVPPGFIRTFSVRAKTAPEVSKALSAAQGSTGHAMTPATGTDPAAPAHAAGEAVTYTVTVRNPNLSTMNVTSVIDVLPEQLRISGQVQRDGALCLECTLSGRNLTLAVPNAQIPAGESRTYTYTGVLTGNERDCLTGVANNVTAKTDAGDGGDAIGTTVCAGGLGVESWWSYVQTSTGAQSQALVNAANGNLVVSATDSTPVQGRGRLGYVLRRTYNSQEPTVATLPGSLGAGWLLNVGFSGDLAGAGVTPTSLAVPTVGQAAEKLTEPLALTLADRDGTRHTFTPKTGIPAVNVTTLSQSLQPQSLKAPSAYSTVCLTTAYDAPPGVQLGLWRYVAVQPSVTSQTDPNVACSNLTPTADRAADAQVVLGYAAVRPDRLRTEFAATGQLLTMVDGSGSRLDYVYRGAGQDRGVVTGPLRFVYEPRSSDGEGRACEITRDLLGEPSLVVRMQVDGQEKLVATDKCRAFTFTYTGQGFTAGTSAGTGEASTEVRDPAGRVTRYDFRKIDLPAGTQGPAMLLTAVVNPPNAGAGSDTVRYSYQGDPNADGTTVDCGASAYQLCQVLDARGAATKVGYDRPSGDAASSLAGLGRVTTLTDRRNTPTTLSYPDRATTVTVRGGQQRRTFSGIDAFGRAARVVDADQNAPTVALHDTQLGWDSDSAGCPDSPAGRDNNLCSQTRLGGSSPDEATSWAYDASGMVLRTRQASAAPADSGTPATLDTTFGYATQHWTTSGPSTSRQGTKGSGLHDPATAAPANTLFTLVDRTEQVSARGNDPATAAVVGRYRTSYTVDNNAAVAPNTAREGDVCAGTPFNTGLVCAVSVPVDPQATGAAEVAITDYAYDAFGQRLRMLTPQNKADSEPAHSYTYAKSTQRDLSGTVSADGWLVGVTDPAGKFVAFGHDAAGNVVRTWDRNATAGRTLAEFPGTLAAPPTSRFAQTLYATGSSEQAIAAPWRWPVAERTPIGDSTTRCLDPNGNVRLERPARGSNGQPILDCATALATPGAFDVLYDTAGGGKAAPDDRPVSVLAPEQRAAGQDPTRVGYDAFGNPEVVTDPRGIPTTTVYDAVNRPVQTRTVRAATAAELPAGADASCPAADGFASVCTATTGYDKVDNPIRAVDPDGKSATAVYNGVHWKTQTVVDGSAPGQSRDASTLTATAGETLRTQVRYDADGNALTVCPPRQFGPETDTGGACTAAGAFSRHYSYDPAGRMRTETTYRAPGSPEAPAQPLVTRYAYDLSGNPTAVTDANDHTTATAFDPLDRAKVVTRPRTANSGFDTILDYDAVGNRITVTEKLDGAPNGATRTDAYSYDAANRLVDSVTGASSPDARLAGLATGEANVRTRTVYDPDGRAVGSYAPRAFQSSTSDPDERFLTWTDVDRNGRPVATFSPRHDTDTGTAGAGDSQATECPAGPQPATLTGGAQPYGAGVGVCVSRMGYDPADRMTVMTLPTAGGAQPADTARKLTVGYTADGLRAKVTGPNPTGTGTVDTLMGYDGSGRPVTISMPGGAERTTTMAYTADGLLAARTEPPVAAGGPTRTTRYGYDLNGAQVRTVDPLNQVTTTVFTADGLTASSADPGGNTNRYTHDAVGNVTRLFDASASAKDATNPQGVATVYLYTADNLLSSELRPTRGDGHRLEVAWDYDGAGRKSTQAMRTVTGAGPGSPGETNPALRVQVADGGRQSFAYSPADRLMTETGRNNESIRAEYDPDGNPRKIIDSTKDEAQQPSTLASEFYLDGLLRSTADGTHTTRYGYDGAGQVSVREHGKTNPAAGDPPVERTVFGYNDAGARLTTSSTATMPANQAWKAEYDPAGRMTKETAPNGQVTTHTYQPNDALAVKKTVADSTASAALVAQWAYTYDSLGRQLTQDHTGQAVNGAEADSDHRYGYDAAGRVTTFADGPNASRQHTATFDANGNRLTYTSPQFTNPQVSTYSPDNTQATSTDLDGANQRTSSYTAFGALAADQCYTYGYDGFDRLTSTTGDPAVLRCATAPTTRYAYDGLDRQRSRTDVELSTDLTAPASTTGLHYDGLGTAVASETLTGDTTTSKTFTLSPTGQPLSLTNNDPLAPSTAYLTDDGTGTITTITGDQPTSAGATAEPFTTCTARFDPWGTATTTGTQNGENGTPGQRATNPCGSTTLTGQQADQGNDRFYRAERRDMTTGNYQLGARTYDPSRTGFLTPDSHRTRQPIADLALGVDPLTTNRYNYVNGDPLNYTDPTGHEPRANHNFSDPNACDNGKCSAQSQAATDGRDRDGSSQTTRSRGTRIRQAQAREEERLAEVERRYEAVLQQGADDFYAYTQSAEEAFYREQILDIGSRIDSRQPVTAAEYQHYLVWADQHGSVVDDEATQLVVETVLTGGAAFGGRATAKALEEALSAAAAKYGDDAAEGIGDARTYIDLTKGGSIRNVGTNTTHTEFAGNLTSGGWISRTSKDGAVQIFQKDGAKYVLRSKNSSGYPGWTADFTPAGSTGKILELRLGYTP